MDDPDTLSIFTSSKVLGYENDEILGPTGAVAIPEFNTRFTRQMLMDTQPKYEPEWHSEDAEEAENAGHGGGDYFVIKKFFNCIRNGEKPDFDVYFATRMASVAILGHRSLMEKGVPYDIPDFSREEDRAKYENDTLTPFVGKNGEAPTYPCCSRPDYVPTEKQRENFKKLIEKNN